MNVGDCYLLFTNRAYEHGRKTGDWTGVYNFMADDAVFVLSIGTPGGGVYQGRCAFVLHHRARQDVFAQSFRDVELTSFVLPDVLPNPGLPGDTVAQVLAASWRKPGLPPLEAEFELRITFEDDLAVRIEERWEPEMTARMHDYLREHGAQLDFCGELLDFAPSADLQLLRRGMQLVERRIAGADALASGDAPPTWAQPIEVQCRSTYRAPGVPDLQLEYALAYRFAEQAPLAVEERWDAAMRAELQTYLAEHGASIRKRVP